jgi:hypothetical protein
MQRLLAAADKAKENLPKVIDRMETRDPRGARIDPSVKPVIFERLEKAGGYLPPFSADNPYLTIEVLWPHATKAGAGSAAGLSYPWYGDAAKTVNGNSIVLRVKHGGNKILLTGDLNEPSMRDLIADMGATARNPGRLEAQVYKAAHHGSQHFLLDFLKIVAPNAAVVSSGDAMYDRHGHPRAVLMGTITRYSKHPTPAVFSTELAACYRKLSVSEQREFRRGSFRPGSRQLYERAINGIVHLRSDGNNLVLATVHGRKPLRPTALDQTRWKWDLWPAE